MHADRHRRSPRCGVWKTACSSRTTLAMMTVHDTVRSTLCQSAMLFSLFIFFGLMCNFFWKPYGDQTANHSTKSVTRQTAKTVIEEDFANVSTDLCMQNILAIEWSQRSRPGSGTFEVSNFRFPTLKPKLAAGQRCKWRLVCEWVCMVTSVSVRIEKTSEMC